MNRYCVISAPRSGTEYLMNILESNIHTHQRYIPNSVLYNLGEIFHWNWYGYSCTYNGLFLNRQSSKNFEDFDSPQRKRHFKFIESVIENKDNAILLKAFVSNWLFDKMDVIAFFEKLKKNNFKILFLKRNFLNSFVSLITANSTGVWHKLNINNQISYDTDETSRLISPDEKIKIDVKTIINTWTETKVQSYYSSIVAKRFDAVTLSYENLHEDIKKIGLTLPESVRNKKIYNYPYSELISNYDEVMEIINFLTDKDNIIIY